MSPLPSAASLLRRLKTEFQTIFHHDPALITRAPGRVNLIGEHTDYNEGFVLPVAIDRAIWIASRPRDDRMVLLHALDTGDVIAISLDGLEKGPGGPGEYVKGMAWALEQDGAQLTGFEGVLLGDVPIGAGLSSSAALEIATARLFSAISNIPWEPLAMARLAQQAENEWVGVRCGIMDQLVSAAGRAGHALLIDCRSLSILPAPLPDEVALVIMDTGIRRGLTLSAYNDRRAACEEVARRLGVSTLRDLHANEFELRRHELDPILQKRARHVLTENTRTLQFYQALQSNDTTKLGDLMRASHISLRDDYQVSCAELDLIVDLANQQPACLGARMTGAGFGGCAVALVQESAALSFADHIAREYTGQSGITGAVYTTTAVNGASIEH